MTPLRYICNFYKPFWVCSQSLSLDRLIAYLKPCNPTQCLVQSEGHTLSMAMLQRGMLFPINSAAWGCRRAPLSACVLPTRFVLAQVRRESLSCSTFPHLLAPDLLPPRSFPQFSSLRAHFINPLFTWLPAILLCRALSPPTWSWTRQSIKLLITVGGCSCRRAQLLTQQVNVPEPASSV